MLAALLSLILLLLFSELASANFKRLAPLLEAWEQSKATHTEPTLWKGGFEKLAVLCWALGTSVPLLAFTVSCNFFVINENSASNFILGTMIGSNVIFLSLGLALLLLSGPLSFFRVRSVTSPVFLLLATVAFTYCSLNDHLTRWEGLLLLILAVGYGFYFRRFSSEWKYFERKHSPSSLLESSEGALPVIAILCLGLGFFVLAVLTAYPFVMKISEISAGNAKVDTKLAVHLVAFLLSIPWLIRSTASVRGSDTERALHISSLSHACLLNVLFLPGINALFWTLTVSSKMISVDLPVLLLLTGIFVSTLLIEKEKGGKLTPFLIASYLLYTGLGLLL